MAQVGNMYDSYHEQYYDPRLTTDRFYVRSSVFLPSSEIDPRTGLLRHDPRRVGRTQAKRLESNQLDQEFEVLDAAMKAHASRKGIRVSLRYSIISVLLLSMVLAIILLVQQGMLAQRQRMLKSINQRIAVTQEANAQLQEQIAIASDSATICYAAARELGMVPAGSMQPIHLMAMDTRPSENTNRVTASADVYQAKEAQALAGE